MTDPQTRVECDSRGLALTGAAAGWPAAGPAAGGGRGTPAAGPTTPAEPYLPGGSAGRASASVTAGGDNVTEAGTSRTWTVELDPLPLLNANNRMHHMARAKATRLIREHAGWKVTAAQIPKLARARIIVEIRFPDTRKRDIGNWYPSAKAAIDGAVDAGLLKDDDDAHLAGPYLIPGPVERDWPRDISRPGLGRGRMRLHITELSEVAR